MSFERYHCIYTEENYGRFSVLVNSKSELRFVYWLELKKHGIRSLATGSEICVKAVEKKVNQIERGLTINSVECFESPSSLPPCALIEDDELDDKKLISILKSNNGLVIFRKCTFSAIDIENLEVIKTLAFFDCEFTGDFRLIASNFSSDIWFSGSHFHKHFSLKSSSVDGDIHLESSNFGGPGGVSLRGVSAKNIYLDFGVNGCEDIFWLNEINVEGSVSLGGRFNNDVEFIGDQDSETETARSRIGCVYIGYEIYDSEVANATAINAKVKIKNTDIETFSIRNSDIRSLDISCCGFNSINLSDVTVEKDFQLSNCSFQYSSSRSIAIDKSSVERHLRFSENEFCGDLSIENSNVEGNAYFEDNEYKDSSLNFHRLSASRFIFLPISGIYRDEYHFPLSLIPRQFNLKEHPDSDKTAEIYCSLKNWFSDSGQLDAEDDSYFFMRQKQPHRILTRLLFGYVFGWGVRLRNIAVSSVILILTFAIAFKVFSPSMSLVTAFVLSVQGFTGSFFGKWPDYEPSGLIAGITVLESIFGIVFITVFIGAYIRKLLR